MTGCSLPNGSIASRKRNDGKGKDCNIFGDTLAAWVDKYSRLPRLYPNISFFIAVLNLPHSPHNELVRIGEEQKWLMEASLNFAF